MHLETPRRETLVQSEILSWLEVQPGCFAWRNNTGVAQYGRRYVRFGGVVGAPDIMCMFRGHFFGIECKAPKKGPKPHQKRWGFLLEAAGGIYIVARSFDEFMSKFATYT